MDEISLVKDFAVIMVVAGIVTLIFRKLNQPPVLGYLLAGLLVGPYTFAHSPVAYDWEPSEAPLQFESVSVQPVVQEVQSSQYMSLFCVPDVTLKQLTPVDMLWFWFPPSSKPH